MKEIVNVKTIKDKLIKFSKERDWEKFHTPKNLAMALTVEVSELLEIFQWSLDGGQDVIENSKEEIESEIADIFNYLVKLVDLLDIDLEINVDEEILGGLIVQMRSKMIDSSLLTRLKSIKNVMNEV